MEIARLFIAEPQARNIQPFDLRMTMTQGISYGSHTHPRHTHARTHAHTSADEDDMTRFKPKSHTRHTYHWQRQHRSLEIAYYNLHSQQQHGAAVTSTRTWCGDANVTRNTNISRLRLGSYMSCSHMKLYMSHGISYMCNKICFIN